MKGYLFIKRIEDIYVPILSLPIYTDRKKVYAELMKINHDEIKKKKEWGFLPKKTQETKINKNLIFNENDNIDNLPIGLCGAVKIEIKN